MDIEINSDVPTVLMIEEMSRRLGIVEGYEYLELYLTPDVSNGEYTEVVLGLGRFKGNKP